MRRWHPIAKAERIFFLPFPDDRTAGGGIAAEVEIMCQAPRTLAKACSRLPAVAAVAGMGWTASLSSSAGLGSEGAARKFPALRASSASTSGRY